MRKNLLRTFFARMDRKNNWGDFWVLKPNKKAVERSETEQIEIPDIPDICLQISKKHIRSSRCTVGRHASLLTCELIGRQAN